MSAWLGTGAESDIAVFLITRHFGMPGYGSPIDAHLGLINTSAAARRPGSVGFLRMAGRCTAPLGYVVVGPLLSLGLGACPVFMAEEVALNA
ncbi:hypothetical protein I0E98_21825 [Pseudomonas lalucatii]|nr:hypothetical protein [Pseudomonas lalucatii]